MKLKRVPDDFLVEELSDFAAGGGPFALYVLEKRNLGTLEAVNAIARKWDVARERVSFGGLKDKHAVSRQFVTVHQGPARNLSQTNFALTYQGQAEREFTSRDILGNRFEIVLRELGAEQLESVLQNLAAAARDGLPNYFDDQRFGSVGESGEFMARPWCQGDYERALWLVLADPNPRDRPREREAKAILREKWGNWQACRGALQDSPHAGIVGFLAHNPRNFRGAITYIRQDLRSLYLAAFQSQIWNEMLAGYLGNHFSDGQRFDVEMAGGSLPFFQSPDASQSDELRSATLPLPSARIHLEEGSLKTLIDRVLARHGLELRELRVKYPRDSFFSKGDRSVAFFPNNVQHDSAADELYSGKHKLTLSFELPRGCYATILIKRIYFRAMS